MVVIASYMKGRYCYLLIACTRKWEVINSAAWPCYVHCFTMIQSPRHSNLVVPSQNLHLDKLMSHITNSSSKLHWRFFVVCTVHDLSPWEEIVTDVLLVPYHEPLSCLPGNVHEGFQISLLHINQVSSYRKPCSSLFGPKRKWHDVNVTWCIWNMLVFHVTWTGYLWMK